MVNKNSYIVLYTALSLLLFANLTADNYDSIKSLEKRFKIFTSQVKEFTNCVRGRKKCTQAEIIKVGSAVVGVSLVIITAIGYRQGWWQPRQKIKITPQVPIITQPVPESPSPKEKKLEQKLQQKEPVKVVDLMTASKSDFPFGEAPIEAELNDRLDNLAQFKLSLVHPAFKDDTNFIKNKMDARFHHHREEVASALNDIEWLKLRPDVSKEWVENKEVILKNNNGKPIQFYSLSAFIQEMAHRFGLMQNNNNRWILNNLPIEDI